MPFSSVIKSERGGIEIHTRAIFFEVNDKGTVIRKKEVNEREREGALASITQHTHTHASEPERS